MLVELRRGENNNMADYLAIYKKEVDQNSTQKNQVFARKSRYKNTTAVTTLIADWALDSSDTVAFVAK